MKHEKKWHTCDRCGVEIERGILAIPTLTLNGILTKNIELCPKCREEFERFMRNE